MAHTKLSFGLALVAAALVSPADAQAQLFEGVLTMRVNGGQRGAQNIDYYASRTGKSRINVNTEQGAIVVIMSPAEKKMFMLIESQAMYVEQDIAQMLSMSASSSQDAKVIRTGRRDVIAGMECEIVKVDELDICGVDKFGSYLFGGAAMRGSVPAWQQALLDDGFFPLRVARQGDVQMEVTKIERKAVDAKLFEVPGHFTRMQLPGRGG